MENSEEKKYILFCDMWNQNPKRVDHLKITLNTQNIKEFHLEITKFPII